MAGLYRLSEDIDGGVDLCYHVCILAAMLAFDLGHSHVGVFQPGTKLAGSRC